MSVEPVHGDSRVAGESVSDRKTMLEIEELRSRLAWDRKVGRFLTLASSLIAAIGFVVGMLQYRDTKAEEFRRRFWEKQLQVYSDFTSTAANIGVATEDSIIQREASKLVRIYNGDLRLIADSAAWIAASEFYNRYLEYTQDPRKQERLIRSSRSTAMAFREALAKSGNVPLTTFGIEEQK